MILRAKLGFAAKFIFGWTICGILKLLSLNGFPLIGEPPVAICSDLIGLAKSCFGVMSY